MGLFVKAYRDSIETLKNSIGIEEKQAYGVGWLPALERRSPHADRIAHHHGVVSCSNLQIPANLQLGLIFDMSDEEAFLFPETRIEFLTGTIFSITRLVTSNMSNKLL